MRAATAVMLLIVAGTIPRGNALSQTPAPRDSVPADSSRMDSTARDSVYRGPIHDPMQYLILPAGVAMGAVIAVVAVTAPPAVLLWDRAAVLVSPVDTTRAGSWNGRAHVYFTGGPAFTDVSGDSPWTHSQNFEYLWKQMHAEIRLEHFHLPGYVHYQTIRAAYLFRRRTLFGGVSLGYREAHGVRGQSGFEIALPLLGAGRNRWARVEPSYVFSRTGATWSFRYYLVESIGDGPFFWGINFEAKSLPLPFEKDRGLTAAGLTVVIGATR